MPKHRYAIMARYMPKVGTRGLDMMFRTATVQVNLDFMSEKDMVAKMRVGLALQPAITALFANSPFTDGKLNGLLSARSEIWRHTDAARTGMLSFVFEPGMGFERYVDYALDVPLYFLKRGGNYQDVAGASFRDLLAGRLRQAPGERATIADWANHLSTIFPEVRLKRYLEMRGADVGPPERIVALAALMAGLYYDPDALGSAEALIEGWSAEDRQKLRDDAPLLGLAAEVRGRDLRSVALDMLAISRSGLKRRARRQRQGRGRDDPASSARGDRGQRPRAGAPLDPALRGPVGPLGRSVVRRGRVLDRASAFQRASSPGLGAAKMRSRPAAGASISAAPAARTAPTNSGASSGPNGVGRARRSAPLGSKPSARGDIAADASAIPVLRHRSARRWATPAARVDRAASPRRSAGFATTKARSGPQARRIAPMTPCRLPK